MAFLANGTGITGSLGDLSAYRMQGVDRIVVRHKGGPSRHRILTHPKFVRTRENNQEWKACTKAASMTSKAITMVKHLADHNYSGALTGLCKSIQLGEGTSDRGERGVLFSQNLYKLEGFGLNKYHTFDSIMRHPLEYEIDRQAGTAIIQLPALQPGINLRNPRKQGMFRLIFTLGMLPDIVYQREFKTYMPAVDIPDNSHAVVHTPWYAFEKGCDAQQVSLSVSDWQEHPMVSLILAAGVDFGQPLSATEVKPTKYAGAAKVLKLV